MKICCRCKLPKEEFVKRDNVERGHCLDCQRKAQLASHNKHKKRYEERNALRRRKRYLLNTLSIIEFLNNHPCINCGETDLIVLDFDHVRGNKKHNISQMIMHYSLENLHIEIAKCEVRCANCHRRKTSNERYSGLRQGTSADIRNMLDEVSAIDKELK